MNRKTWGLALAAAVLVAVAGCGDDDATPGMDAGADASRDGGGTVADADNDAGLATDAGDDASTARAFGSECASPADCESGLCVRLFSAFGIGTGYCSKTCAGPTECTGDPESYTYTCLPDGSGASRCVRTCESGFGCPSTDICITNFPVPGAGNRDACLDLSHDGCTRDADCTAPETCLPLGDRERGFLACFAPRNGAGAPRALQPLGTACDPTFTTPRPCRSSADCPVGFTCPPAPGGERLCLPPDSGLCTFFCSAPGATPGTGGLCSGLCTGDADCPADMRCARAPFVLNNQGTAEVWDDQVTDLSVCLYARGSRTACTRDADCMTTGAGGTREVCVAGFDATGARILQCMTRPPMGPYPGDACGDDPGTDALEPGYCSGMCTAEVCGGLCATRADCPAAAGWECSPYAIAPGTTANFCALRPPCVRDADCTGGQVCRVFDDAASFHGACAAPLGGLAAGAACSTALPFGLASAARCASGFCRDVGRGTTEGRCLAFCSTDTDCPTDHVCAHADLTRDGAGTLTRTDDVVGAASICVYLPGTRATCTLDADCTATETCVQLSGSTGTPVRRCTMRPTGGRATGEACGPATPCASTFCMESWFDPAAAYCTALCGADADCPTGLVCRRYTGDIVIEQTICMEAGDPRGLPL